MRIGLKEDLVVKSVRGDLAKGSLRTSKINEEHKVYTNLWACNNHRLSVIQLHLPSKRMEEISRCCNIQEEEINILMVLIKELVSNLQMLSLWILLL